MIQCTAAELAARVGARQVVGDPERPIGPDVVIDSRLATASALFVAFEGEHVDGHDYLVSAAGRGASAALVRRLQTLPDGCELVQLVVDDVLDGLGRLARSLVEQGQNRGLQVLALTGSSGKTSTKDVLAQLLEADGPTIAPRGSFNNEIGVPLTATGIDEQTKYLVAEMGARGIGHIAWLVHLVPANIAAVLNVGTAHLGEFGSREAIALAKSEILAELPGNGWAIRNLDDPLVAAMASPARPCWFGVGSTAPDDADAVVASDLSADALQRHRCTITFTGPDVEPVSGTVQLPFLGAHHVANAVAAAAMAWKAGVGPESIITTLNRLQHRSRWRMEVVDRPDGAIIVNDAYNANPDSMRAALTTMGPLIAAHRTEHPDARATAVLGDMLELGQAADAEHREAGRLAAQCGFDEVLALGEFAEQLVQGARAAGAAGRVVTAEVAGSHRVGPDDIVLLKASRGIGLEVVAEALVANTPTDAEQLGGGRAC